MMISPKTYYDLHLKDKNEKEILKEIRNLKKEIRQLKDIMEYPFYEPTNKPDEATQLWCNRLYLEQAKQALEAIGVAYKPNLRETNTQLFNDNIPYIKTIEYESMGYLEGLTNIIVTFNNNQAIIEKNNLYHLELPTKVHLDKEDFLEELRLLEIGEWKRKYTLDKYNLIVMDGIEWKLTITYSNGYKTKKVFGNNAYPYNYDQFIELLDNEDYLKYTIDLNTKNEFIQRMIHKIKELPKETEISTYELLESISNNIEYKDNNYIFDNISLSFTDMMSLNDELINTLVDEDIEIDNTIHNDEVLGLAFHIGFLIKK